MVEQQFARFLPDDDEANPFAVEHDVAGKASIVRRLETLARADGVEASYPFQTRTHRVNTQGDQMFQVVLRSRCQCDGNWGCGGVGNGRLKGSEP